MQLGREVFSHFSYLPDLSEFDFHLLRALEHSIRNKRFKDHDDARAHLGFPFRSKNTKFYEEGIEALLGV